MSEIQTTLSAETESNPTVEELFGELTSLEPKPVGDFVPANAVEQKDLFLSGGVRNPEHQYERLSAIDFDANRLSIANIGERILTHPDAQEKYIGAYRQFISNYIRKTDFVELAYKVKAAETDEEKATAKLNYMKLNVELYGEPDQIAYRSLVNESIAVIQSKELSNAGQKIRQELFELIDTDLTGGAERFRPAAETIAWINDIANSEDSLYGNLLAHVPEQDTFTAVEIKAVFEAVITQEFDLTLASQDTDSGKLWSVVVENAQSINVKAAEKKIVIPTGREVDKEAMTGLVAHEIGVHFLRSVMGEQADLDPLKRGLNDYYDTEEGLGVVMEQAVNGTYKEAGTGHYITAGLAYFDGKDFRDIFETKWRLGLLVDTEGSPSEDDIVKVKNSAYRSTMRIMRGTDKLPWFKDLSYYNGAAEVWKHLEAIRGDDTEFLLVLLGKANAANVDHRRILLETATV